MQTMLLEERIKAPATRSAPRVWDVICIGSGVSALTAGATLAKMGRSVLLLEAHSQLGGMTHTFKRKGMRWGTGLHYTGWPTAYYNDFAEIWDLLTGGQAGWLALPDNAETLLRPDGSMLVKHAPRERCREDLLAAFPGERPAIDRYLKDIRTATDEFTRFAMLQAVPPIVEKLGLGWWLGRRFLATDRLPLMSYMDQIGASDRLRDALWLSWCNIGGVPTDTSLGSHALPAEYMIDGHKMLAGGSQSAAPAFSSTITAAGGELRHNAPVSGLLFEGGRVAGVIVHGEAIRGRVVISSIGARETYHMLLPPGRRPAHAERIIGMKPSCSMFSLYLALDRRALDLYGLTGVNYWAECRPGGLRQHWTDLDAPPPWLLLSMAARFHSSPAHSDTALGEIFTTLPGDLFARWEGTRVMKRGAEYDDLKEQLAERVFSQMERFWPGIRQYIRYSEGATPLTIQSYTRHFNGSAYGIAPAPGRYNERALRVLSGVPGLLLTGQDIVSPGMVGAFYGGLTTASALLRGNARTVLLRKRGRTQGQAQGQPRPVRHDLQRA
jgi:all-trans-retinol 13,14-reductase